MSRKKACYFFSLVLLRPLHAMNLWSFSSLKKVSWPVLVLLHLHPSESVSLGCNTREVDDTFLASSSVFSFSSTPMCSGTQWRVPLLLPQASLRLYIPKLSWTWWQENSVPRWLLDYPTLRRCSVHFILYPDLLLHINDDGVNLHLK